MTSEEIKFLEKYKGHFESLIKSSWCPSFPTTDAQKMKDIYLKYSDQKINVNLHCSKCLGNMMRSLYSIYLKEIEKPEEPKTEEQIVEEVKEVEEPKVISKPKAKKQKKH